MESLFTFPRALDVPLLTQIFMEEYASYSGHPQDAQLTNIPKDFDLNVT
jgi:hypothetical protein